MFLGLMERIIHLSLCPHVIILLSTDLPFMKIRHLQPEATIFGSAVVLQEPKHMIFKLISGLMRLIIHLPSECDNNSAIL